MIKFHAKNNGLKKVLALTFYPLNSNFFVFFKTHNMLLQII